MATKTIAWNEGSGYITVTYGGSGDGTAVITSSDNNLYEARSQQITFQTTAGSPQRTVTVTVAQAAKQRIDLSAAIVTAADQTYSGSAKTPVPTVTLNGDTVPSTGYDVAYSNNTNAGTATITITGKGDYTGIATGTFTIAKANPVYVAPTANNRTYNTSSAALLVAGSNTTPGTFTYCATQSGTYSTTIPSQTNAGTYTTYWKFTPTDTTNYNSIGATAVSTTISPKTVSSPTITLSQSTYTYDGNAKTPTPTVKDGSTTISSSEYTVSYSNNTNAGTATCTITDKSGGNYTVSGSKTFTISKASRTLSFTDSIVVLPPSSNVTKTATPSAGSGDGAITYSIASTTYATINSSTGKVTSKSSEGKTTVTATIAAGTNYQSASASYTLYVFATTHNYSTASSYSSLTLPAGTYKLQCWGAQGGSNAADSTYGITAQAGGKGGYSEGQLTVASETTVRAYVGGQGSSSAGGYNGGGSTTGSSTYNSSNVLGISKMGGGGGASDVRLSDGTLLSRMIVAGGGSGGAASCKRTTTSTTQWQSYPITVGMSSSFMSPGGDENAVIGHYAGYYISNLVYLNAGEVFRVTDNQGDGNYSLMFRSTTSSFDTGKFTGLIIHSNAQPSGTYTVSIAGYYGFSGTNNGLTVEKQVTIESHTDELTTQVGYVGGGSNGGGYSSIYYASQTAAGNGGSFGNGANQTKTNYRYCSGAGGGGWYGGGGGVGSDTDRVYCQLSGGGSGWVNTSASAGNRPSGYTGLQLDSGTTYDGTQTFVAPGGGNETGHSGNGYVRITRIEAQSVYNFDYTGAVQNVSLPAGTYKLEAWGAQGGSTNTTYVGGKGGYSVGELTLAAQTTLYVYVGGQGAETPSANSAATGGFNGGGNAYTITNSSRKGGSGGGASDIRIGADSLYARVIVAGGGGGAGAYDSSNAYDGGYGGGTTGGTPSQYSSTYASGTGGSQTAGGDSYYYSKGKKTNSSTFGTLAAFGIGGGRLANNSTAYNIHGGGGGWYGGGYSMRGAGGGGSGYVYTSSTASNYPSGCLLNSNYYLTDSSITAGNASITSPSGSNETGHAGNGYVRITRL